MNYGMIRVAAASIKLKVANPSYNKEQIKNAIDKAVEENVRLLVTPELALSASTCGDLFFTKSLQNACRDALLEIAAYTADKNIVVIVGVPVAARDRLYNCAAVLFDGEICELTAKRLFSNSDEKRYFAALEEEIFSEQYQTSITSESTYFLCDGVTVGIEFGDELGAPQPPSTQQALFGANIIVNLSANAELVSRANYRRELVKSQSARCISAYVYAGTSVFESTTDLVFSGATLIAENGEIIAEGERFVRDNVLTIADVDCEKLDLLRQKNELFVPNDLDNDYCDCQIDDFENEYNDLKFRTVDPHPFIPNDENERNERCREIFAIQAAGLAKRLEHIGSKGCVIGISGGLDSTLALLVSVEAMKLLGKPMSDIIGITMPGFGTTDRTYNNALELMKKLGITVKEISIKDACLQHMKDIGHDPDVKDVTYENMQARERTQILFDVANMNGCLLVGTGDLSELAMGWCTFSGDQMSMYGVNASVPKTLVRYLVRYVAENSNEDIKAILLDILDTPVSPELLPPDEDGRIAQKTEDNIGPYELHDFFIYNFVRFGYNKEKLQKLAEIAFDGVYDRFTINKWLGVFMKRFFISQFKRSCSPDGPKVGSVSLSPRGDWHMPSDASYEDFI